MAKLIRALIMGPPGSGKGTISKRIAQSFGLEYLSSGHYLRQSITANTEAGVLVKSYVERGMLVPDHIINRLMIPRLEQLSGHSWLLDGKNQMAHFCKPHICSHTAYSHISVVQDV
ncbi:adenylate kinase 4, mitochondrial-like [Thalassophryne amazonica]|uniref:adenylate kinase 4, mitochondrial-like n=1 Tax=Thalassophryne amazonica TaxID=390379 RepID=UPI0014709919|nr:adenylate kinase 4, mitochondrial-like [Thalassophryne amazonica]